VKKDVSILLTSLLSKLTALEKFESMIHKFQEEAASSSNSLPNSVSKISSL
jgi:hypothetical protein